MNAKKFLLRTLEFSESWSYIIIHYPVKFGVHRICGIGDITFFVCHETTRNYAIKELWDFVYGGPIP